MLRTYDKIFYVVPELSIKEDGERSTGKEFFDGVVNQFDFYLKHHSMPADKLVYVMGTVEERVKIITNNITKDFTNEL